MSLATDALAGAPARVAAGRGPNLPVVAAATAGLGLGALALYATVPWRTATLFLVGGALGLVLYHALFGFTSAWRVFVNERRGAGLRAQMILLAVASLLFFPALAAGELFGQPVNGFVSPVGVSVILGAFLFGLGMQLGGGCASGTLYVAGGGNTRMMVTLLFFVVGSLIGSAHAPFWWSQANIGAVSLIESFGWVPALILNLAVFAAIALGTVFLERKRYGRLLPTNESQVHGLRRFLQGPWPLVWGAVALALLNFATLALAGRPWGITSAFALWGAKGAGALGLDVSGWDYWQLPGNAAALEASVFTDITSVMNFGLILGALAAAGLAGKFAPVWKLPLASLAAAVIGGLLMGYGARLAFGCNIGAYFSGIASASLHAWVWLAAAFVGSTLGTKLRPSFGLDPKVKQTGC